MIDDPGTLTFWIFKAIANGFVALVFAGVVLAVLRELRE